jgi:tetratricopeptide (TPR) repeat protein
MRNPGDLDYNERMNNLIPILILCILYCMPAVEPYAGGQEKSETFDRGVIIERVLCRDDPSQSYALYLPEAYSKDSKWPVLFAQDPGGVGSRPLAYFREAAGTYQYILVGLNNSRNGPWEPILKAIHTVWHDTRHRFSIDEKRIYTTGFSGGARAASAFPLEIQKDIAGTIACGAGIPTWMKPEQVRASYFYGIIGLWDFNYRELADLDETLRAHGVDHRIEVIDGGHRWPPEAVCTRAVAWLEIDGMKKGFRPKDPVLIDTVYEKILKRAGELEAAGHLLSAAETCESAAALFDGLRDVTAMREKGAALARSRPYQQMRDEERARHKNELKHVADFQRIFEQIESPEGAGLDRKKLFAGLHIEPLEKTAGDQDHPRDSAMALRLLYDLSVHAEEKGLAYLEKKDAARAVRFYEIAVRTRDPNPYLYYNLACAYAVRDSREEALFYFSRAVDGGFRDTAFFEKDRDLDNIRQEKVFQDILKRLKSENGGD